MTIKVSELPVGTYLDQFKARLNKLEDAEFVKDYEDRSTEQGFDFTITVPRSTTSLSLEELYKKFGMISRDTENLTLWSTEGRLKRYDSAEAIVEEFVTWRETVFEVRRQHGIVTTEGDISWCSERIRFITFYLKNTMVFKNTGKKELVELLLKNSFADYDRLLSMSMWNLTRDKISELEKELDELRKQLATMKSDTAKAMFTRELKQLSASF